MLGDLQVSQTRMPTAAITANGVVDDTLHRHDVRQPVVTRPERIRRLHLDQIRLIGALRAQEFFLFTKSYLKLSMIYPHLVDVIAHPTQAC